MNGIKIMNVILITLIPEPMKKSTVDFLSDIFYSISMKIYNEDNSDLP